MGISEGLNIAARAMGAYQIAMQTIGHNIANANTEGYSRQKATLVATEPTQLSMGAVGTGVKVADIRRIRDAFLDVQMYGDQGVL
ncbi:MAG: flagellar basal body protein, partial [Candidatus Omnitrophica bacterium]|nr:flagellar basal body protein [Candidatus Omnitrophota bacterium]